MSDLVLTNHIDKVVGKEILHPVTDNFLKSAVVIEKSCPEKEQFSKEDKENYKKLLKELKNIIPLINNNYYVSDSTEGAKPTLAIQNMDELKKLYSRLKNLQRKGC
ncbi:hypothetical protein Bbad01_31690 [Bacillus badius]|nr:hypothetical protein Bbad01_31690 [Bacillus badius]